MFWHRNLNIVASSVKCILQFGPIDQKHCFVKATNKIENVELVKCGTVEVIERFNCTKFQMTTVRH